jgi:glycosyltransferase involved in cell wall biosynthesis
MTITVYLPTHNRVELLSRALESILRQTLTATEIIVVDDGSRDATPEFMAAFCVANPQCRYLRNDVPAGACVARNRAIEAASSEFITGMDDDDELLPNHLESLYMAFSPDKSCVVSSILEDTGSNRIERKLDVGTVALDQILHYNKLGNQVFTRTERLRDIAGFDPAFPAFQDYDTWVRLIEKFGPAEKIADATYIWHTGHEQGRISHSPVKRLRALELFKDKHAHLLKPKHLASLEVMRIRMAGEAFSFRRMLSLINKGNWKAAVALYLNTNLAGFKQRLDRMRHS